ncbi:MAG: hypothetical protein KDE09_03415 [Anaerolineales bacterium]|nr:hypothetical protein [Anaerolineales bacterium]MCB0010428.1 hypothetical protein [Anaerolineales bacterium]MCB0016810.1 hypothetical protein [Anaerolineales bacterium]MCB8961947.1 hypothetical protein [Ardenticatenales bacterium]
MMLGHHVRMETTAPHHYPLTFTAAQNELADRCLAELSNRIGSPLVMITDISGRLMLYHGRLSLTQGDGLGALSAGGFAAGAEIGNFLGLRATHGFKRLLLEGKAANLYITLIDEELLLITAFTHQVTLGMVRLYAEQAHQELGRLIQEARHNREHAGSAAMPDTGDDFADEVFRQLDDLLDGDLI